MCKQAVVLFYVITAMLHPVLGYITQKKALGKIQGDHTKTEKEWICGSMPSFLLHQP